MKSIIALLGILSISLAASASAVQKDCRAVLKVAMADGTVIERPFESKESWGRQLIELRLDAINDFNRRTAKLTNAEKLKIVFGEDFRKFFFQLESLARVYEKYDQSFFKSLRAEFKSIEDQIGYVDLQISLKNKAAELKLSDIENYYSKRQAEGEGKLIALFADWNDKKVESVRKKVVDYSDWLPGKKDRKFLVDKIHDELRDLAKDSENFKFDQPEIEQGLHELRRRIRWIVIEVLSLNHVVTYEKESSLPGGVDNWFQELLAQDPDILNNKYMKIDDSAIKKPVLIPLQMHGIITKIVGTIGKLKDASELQIEFTKAMKALGYTSEQVQTVLATLNANLKIQQVDHEKLSHDYQQKLNDSRLLREFAKQLKDLN